LEFWNYINQEKYQIEPEKEKSDESTTLIMKINEKKKTKKVFGVNIENTFYLVAFLFF